MQYRMVKLSLLLFIMGSVSIPSYGNSGNLLQIGAQQQFRETYLISTDFITSCLHNELDCQISIEQRELLRKIRAELYEFSHELIFISETKNPGNFSIDGDIRIAKTGNNLGDTIYINSDLLIKKDPLDIDRPLRIEEMIVTIIHELGHHHKSIDGTKPSHEALDLLGAKVGTFMKKQKKEYEVNSWDWIALERDQSIKLLLYHTAFRTGDGMQKTFMFLSGPFGFKNLQDIWQKTGCPKIQLFGDLFFEGKPLFAYFGHHQFDWSSNSDQYGKLLVSSPQLTMICQQTLEGEPKNYQIFSQYRNAKIVIPFFHDGVTLKVETEQTILQVEYPEIVNGF